MAARGGVEVGEADPGRGPVQQRECRGAVGHVEVGGAPGGLDPVDDAGDAQVPAVPGEQDVARVEVAVQEAGFVGGRVTAYDVHRAVPQIGTARALGRPDALGRRPGLVGARPVLLADVQAVDAHELAGQQPGPRPGLRVLKAYTAWEVGHEQRGVVAVLRRRVDGVELGGGDGGGGEQFQDARLTGEQALRVPQVEGLHEGAQHQLASRSGPGDPQAAHLRGPAAAQPLRRVDAFALAQVPVHPGAGGRPAGLVPLRHGHRGTLPGPLVRRWPAAVGRAPSRSATSRWPGGGPRPGRRAR